MNPGDGTLFSATNNAAAGSVLCLTAGTYTATSDDTVAEFSKNLTISGVGDATEIDFSPGGAFRLSGGTVSIKNLKITRTFSSAGRVYVSGSTVTLQNVTIDQSKTSDAAGLNIATGSAVTVKDSTIKNCTFRGVTMTGGTLALEGSTITSNSVASGQGGGIYASGAPITMDATSQITNNTASASAGGAVYLIASSSFTDNGGSITGNSAKTNGGAISLSAAANTFTNNGGTFTISSGTLSGNVVTTCNDVYSAAAARCCTPVNGVVTCPAG